MKEKNDSEVTVTLSPQQPPRPLASSADAHAEPNFDNERLSLTGTFQWYIGFRKFLKEIKSKAGLEMKKLGLS
jgi:hypothetical protein